MTYTFCFNFFKKYNLAFFLTLVRKGKFERSVAHTLIWCFLPKRNVVPLLKKKKNPAKAPDQQPPSFCTIRNMTIIISFQLKLGTHGPPRFAKPLFWEVFSNFVPYLASSPHSALSAVMPHDGMRQPLWIFLF